VVVTPFEDAEEAATVDVRPSAMVAGGTAIARTDDGRVLFVDGALPDEAVRAKITGEHRNHATARVVEVLEPSASRREPPCPAVARGCGACTWQHIDLDAQRAFKADIVRDALRRLGRVDPPEFLPTTALEPWAFRTTVRAVVEGDRAGLRRAQSHDAVIVDECLVAHPLVNELLIEGRYPGAREVLLRCGARTGKRLAAVTPSHAQRDAVVPDDVHAAFLYEVAAGRSWKISASSFFQARADGVDALAEAVTESAARFAIPGRAVDLYSGVGVFAGVLAAAGWAVVAVEGERSAVRDARANLRGLPVDVVRADVNRWAPPAPSDLVIADPSRAGLGRAGVETIAATNAARVVVVHCDAASLGRDAGLLEQHGYALTSVRLVDLFPHTAHVEVVSTFDR
jgi:23S rRNA (uracil1939-C5)-methyltransferase